MTIENTIKNMLEIKMNDGTVEKLIEEHFEEGIKNALENLFRTYGDATKEIEKKVRDIVIPHIQNYDYSKYVIKLDSILTEVLKETTIENRSLLENFRYIMSTEEKLESIKVSEIVDKWIEHVKENVETAGLEVNYDDGISYDYVPVRFEVEHEESSYDWTIYKYANLILECEHDENMNFAIRLSRWKSDRKEGYELQYENRYDIKSIRYLNSFEMFLMKLEQNNTRIIIDEEYGNDDIIPKKEPEPTFS